MLQNLILKLFPYQNYCFFIFNILLVLLFQNIINFQTITYCLEEIQEKIIDKTTSDTAAIATTPEEQNFNKIIAFGLFLGTFFIFWLYCFKLGGGNSPTIIPIDSNIPSSTIQNNALEMLSNENNMIQDEHFTSVDKIFKGNDLIIADNDWVKGSLYKDLFLHDKRIVEQTIYQAEYIEEINKQFRDKKILINGQNATFRPYDSWLYDAMNNKK